MLVIHFGNFSTDVVSDFAALTWAEKKLQEYTDWIREGAPYSPDKVYNIYVGTEAMLGALRVKYAQSGITDEVAVIFYDLDNRQIVKSALDRYGMVSQWPSTTPADTILDHLLSIEA